MNGNDYIKALSENIYALRKKMGLTQESLADKLGVTFQAVSKWENGQSSPDMVLLPQIADIFGVHIDELFGRKITLESHTNFSGDLPWKDDETLRGVIFKGHKILDKCDDISQFTFHYTGDSLNVVSHCNIECGEIQNGAKASVNINCNTINGGAKAMVDINCSGDINGGASSACDINVGGSISGGASSGCDINVSNSISGGVSCSGDIAADKITGDVKCDGDIACHIIEGNATCGGDITYS